MQFSGREVFCAETFPLLWSIISCNFYLAHHPSARWDVGKPCRRRAEAPVVMGVPGNEGRSADADHRQESAL